MRAIFLVREKLLRDAWLKLDMADPIIEITIQTGNPAEDKIVEQLLETLKAEEAIRRILHSVHVQETVMLTLLVTGDEEIAVLNLQYRQQDKPTDVLSFPLLDEPLVEAPAELLWQAFSDEEEGAESAEVQESKPIFVTPAELALNLGDIAISWPTVQRQASSAGHDVTYELLFLLCHGVLHLVGYDDQTEAGYAEMVRLQMEVLTEMTREG